jgi:ATP-dependent exoDNAse (exonuclease V) alpha subunit
MSNDTLGIINSIMGTVISYNQTTKTVQVAVAPNNIVQCNKVNFEVYRLTYNEYTDKVDNQCVAVINRHPFILSYATTVHRCQDLTLDTMIFNSFDGCFAPGQLYTAISRVKKINDLFLHVKIDTNDIIVSPAVINYFRFFKDKCTEARENLSCFD